jgi:hypothetical protein
MYVFNHAVTSVSQLYHQKLVFSNLLGKSRIFFLLQMIESVFLGSPYRGLTVHVPSRLSQLTYTHFIAEKYRRPCLP